MLSHDPDLDEVGTVVLFDADHAQEHAALLMDYGLDVPMFVVKKGKCVRLPRSMAQAQGGGAAERSLPKITVVSLSFNQAQYLEQSIRSVLDQNYPNLEYILIDGNSTDGSIEIINKYRSRMSAVVIEPDEGQSDALNKGFALATGDVMNWLCSDDLLEPGSLHAIGRAYRERTADVIVGGCVRVGNSRSDVLFEHHNCFSLGQTVQLDPLDLLKFMGSWQKGKYFFQPETFFSRRAWLAAGGYIKKHLYYVMDYDLWLRMALAGATVRHIPRIIGCSRVHEAQKTKQDEVYLYQVYQLMEEYSDMFSAVYNSVRKPL
jgi:glycosyltransferase involved in cell wall biosynthesis